MNQKPGFFQKAEHFLTGRGFYMVLILCLLVLGASGYYLYRSAVGTADADSSQTTPANAAVTVTVPSQEAVDAVTAPQEEEAVPASEPEETAPVSIDEPAEEVVTPAEETVAPDEEELPVVEPIPVLRWPLDGEVANAYSSTELQYNAAMGDWRTHSGVDIAAAMGSEVCAAADGTVESVASDPIDGLTVTVSHSGGMSTSYANLDPDTLAVSAGDAVEAGQALACVGSSAAGESTVGGHLHFSVIQDGTPVDPMDYLP